MDEGWDQIGEVSRSIGFAGEVGPKASSTQRTLSYNRNSSCNGLARRSVARDAAYGIRGLGRV